VSLHVDYAGDASPLNACGWWDGVQIILCDYLLRMQLQVRRITDWIRFDLSECRMAATRSEVSNVLILCREFGR